MVEKTKKTDTVKAKKVAEVKVTTKEPTKNVAPKLVKATPKPTKTEKVKVEEKKKEIVKEQPKPTEEAPVEQPKPAEPKKIEKKLSFNFKLFGRWDQQITVMDLGLKRYMTLTPLLVPFSQGRTIKKQFWKSQKHIVERLILKTMVAGHKGKRHYRDNGHNTGKYSQATNTIIKTFEIIEQKTKKNPLEVYIRAIENSAPREGVTTIEYGGVRYPKAVDLSPQRRIDLSLRWLTQGASHAKAGKGKKDGIAQSLAKQIMLSADGDQASNAVQKRFEMERSSSASR
jgi:small subunit ribosomal protein S7